MGRRDGWHGSHWCRPSTRLAVYLRDALSCIWCGKGIEDGIAFTLDHLQAVEEGGSNDPSNLVTACMECNRRRGNINKDKWCKSLGKDIALKVKKQTKKDLTPYRKEAREILRSRPEWLKRLRENSNHNHNGEEK